ncbi:MAG: hypothetical protein H7333_12595 [Bdellovibrionales bacterium]|nr:hypothetical protein [Oligoflexia bacterium]
MKYLILICLFLTENTAQARPAADQCFLELTCAGRVHRYDNNRASRSEQDLLIAYFAVDFGRVMPLPELQEKYSVRLKAFEGVCNRERYRRSTFGPNPWNQDSRLNWMKSDMKCWSDVGGAGACRSSGQACQSSSDCCTSGEVLGRCDSTRGACVGRTLMDNIAHPLLNNP